MTTGKDHLAIAADSDRGAVTEIQDRYADRLYDFCLLLLGDRDAAAQCVRATFDVALTDRGVLCETDELRASLYSIARRHAMDHLLHRRPEEVFGAPPETTVTEQSGLAHLIADVAGGLSDRDREVLELSYRHSLEGPELAQVLGVTLAAANARVLQLRRRVRRSVAALLSARNARADGNACPELVALLDGWDGQLTELMRRRISRHTESCQGCERVPRVRIDPAALLGVAPIFIAAPAWLRETTLDRAQLAAQPPEPAIVRSKKS